MTPEKLPPDHNPSQCTDPASLSLKVCPRCGWSKVLDEFARDASKASGRKSACKVCDAERARRWYAANSKAVIARQLAARAAKMDVPTEGV
jgi:hypothetical protein